MLAVHGDTRLQDHKPSAATALLPAKPEPTPSAARQVSLDGLRSGKVGSFKDRRLKRLYERGDRSKIDPRDIDRVRLVLDHLDPALTLDNLNVHSYRLHRLTGDLAGLWSMTVRASWRIIFRFEDGSAFDIELIDYY